MYFQQMIRQCGLKVEIFDVEVKSISELRALNFNKNKQDFVSQTPKVVDISLYRKLRAGRPVKG